MRRQRAAPLAAYREDPLLFLLTLGAAATSVVALLAHLAGLIRMPYTLSFLTAPGMVFLLGVMVRAGRVQRPLIVNRLRVGLVAGLLGLVVYNGARWLVSVLLAVKASPFYSIYIFGDLITGMPDTLIAAVAGWLYHLSNGVTFAIIYVLMVGPSRWWFGLVWGLCLEMAMLVIYPSSAILRPPALASFVIVSLVSHAMYGTTVGVVARRYALARTEG